MIDFHSHIDLYPNPSAIIEECVKRKTYVLSVTTTPSAWRITSSLAAYKPRIQTALGLHPQIAHLRFKELDLFDSLLSEAKYVGEIGLDGSPEFKSHLKIQLDVLTHILNSCERKGGYIMSIHSRRAVTPLLDNLENHSDSGTPVMHWFSGNKSELDRAIRMGCWFSVGPTMLSSKKGKDLVSHIPKSRILTESDGPFAKIDGEIAMPWDAEKANQYLAEIWNLPLQEVQIQLIENFKRLLKTSELP